MLSSLAGVVRFSRLQSRCVKLSVFLDEEREVGERTNLNAFSPLALFLFPTTNRVTISLSHYTGEVLPIEGPTQERLTMSTKDLDTCSETFLVEKITLTDYITSHSR